MITIEPGEVGAFGNEQLSLGIALNGLRTALAAVAMNGDGLGEADPESSFRAQLSTTTGDMAALVSDLVATLEVDGEALLLVAAQNIDANAGTGG